MKLYEEGDEIIIIANPDLTGTVVKGQESSTDSADVQFDVDGNPVAYVLPHEMMLKSIYDEFHPKG